MPGAGKLTERIAFDVVVQASDGFGGTTEGHEEQFTVSARVQHKSGGEEVMAARLQGTQTVILTVRRSSQTERITTDWRARNLRKPFETFNIREVRWPEDRAWIEIMAQSGVAV